MFNENQFTQFFKIKDYAPSGVTVSTIQAFMADSDLEVGDAYIFQEDGIGAASNTAQVETVTLAGTTGSTAITINGIAYTATFDTNLATTASNFVTAYEADLAARGVIVNSSSAALAFTAGVPGVPFTISIANTSMTSTLAHTTANAGGTTNGTKFMLAVYDLAASHDGGLTLSSIIDAKKVIPSSLKTKAGQAWTASTWAITGIYSKTADYRYMATLSMKEVDSLSVENRENVPAIYTVKTGDTWYDVYVGLATAMSLNLMYKPLVEGGEDTLITLTAGTSPKVPKNGYLTPVITCTADNVVLTTTQRDAISSPSNGDTCYVRATDTIYTHNGSNWTTTASAAATSSDFTLTFTEKAPKWIGRHNKWYPNYFSIGVHGFTNADAVLASPASVTETLGNPAINTAYQIANKEWFHKIERQDGYVTGNVLVEQAKVYEVTPGTSAMYTLEFDFYENDTMNGTFPQKSVGKVFIVAESAAEINALAASIELFLANAGISTTFADL